RPRAMDRSASRRHQRPARQLVLLFPARHVDPALAAAHPAVLAVRPPVRSSLAAVLTAAAVLTSVVAMGAAPETIRVLILDGARVAELRGADIEIAEVGSGAAARRAEIVRAIPIVGSIEIDGRRAPAFRLRSERPIRINGRDYPGTLEISRS